MNLFTSGEDISKGKTLKVAKTTFFLKILLSKLKKSLKIKNFLYFFSHFLLRENFSNISAKEKSSLYFLL